MRGARLALVLWMAGLFLAGSQASASLVVDRGLPNANLNLAAGANRSNAAWGFNQNQFFTGDDFILPGGDQWRITSLRVWIPAGAFNDPAFQLGDRFSDVALFGGPSIGGVSLLQSGAFSPNANATDNPNIVISQVLYNHLVETTYQTTSGLLANLWQVEFTNLDWLVNAGQSLKFGVHGRTIDSNLAWFNHASNAALSGTPQDGSDNLIRVFDRMNLLSGDVLVDTNQVGFWDKSSDINVQVFATPIPEPSSMLLAGLGLAVIGWGLRRRAGGTAKTHADR